MKTLIFFMIPLVFTTWVCICLAETNKESDSPNWVSGTVESIQSGKESSLVSVKMRNGEQFNFSSANDKLEGIKVGDGISANVTKGWAESVTKLKEAVDVVKPKEDSTEFQWVSGEITAIKMGKESSLVSVKTEDGDNFKFSAANQLVNGITLGDRVKAKIYRGWAESIDTGAAKPKP